MCIRDRHYQVTYTVEQHITEGESGKTVRSAYQVTVYVDGSGNLTIIQNPTITSVPVKSGYTPKAVQSDGTVDSITTEEINEFLTTFFKPYPTATAKELTYYCLLYTSLLHFRYGASSDCFMAAVH